MPEPIWISVELAIAIHQRQLAEHGGADGVRDAALLESALNRPRHLHAYPDPKPNVENLGASYAFGIAKNHAFVDGNKRTAAVVCETFLNLNGFELTASDAEMYPVLLSLAAGQLDEVGFAAWLKQHSHPNVP